MFVFQEGVWLWEKTGVPFKFTAWHLNQPDNLMGNQNCLMLALNKEFEWDDNNCQNHRNVICEKSK